jgi:hypothetical protein
MAALMNTFKVWGGSDVQSKVVRQLGVTLWQEFVTETLGHPILLNVTRAEFAAMDKKQRSKIKNVNYVTPACFKTNPANRAYENADTFCLVALDIDVDPDGGTPAKPFTDQPFLVEALLLGLQFAVYTTASHTIAGPRIRIFVAADNLSVARYPDAVRTVAQMLELSHVTKESLICVQPMFLPTAFKDDPEKFNPLIISSLHGRPLQLSDLMAAPTLNEPKDIDLIPANDSFSTLGVTTNKSEITLGVIKSALRCIPADLPRPEWIKILAAVKSHCTGPLETAGFQMCDEWSSNGGDKYEGRQHTLMTWKSLRATIEGRDPVRIGTLIRMAQQGGWDMAKAIAEDKKSLSPNAQKELIDFINSRLFDVDKPPPPEPVIYWIGGVPISTPGNLTVISAHIKTGKTNFVCAGVASILPIGPSPLKGWDGNPDFLAWRSDGNPTGKKVLHFDTEQSLGDRHNSVLLSLRRAGIERQPDFQKSYCLTGESALRQLTTIVFTIEEWSRRASIHSIWIDGIGDLVTSVNEEKEANEMLARIRNLAIQAQAGIICSLHLNPGTNKTRGHIGSELERKAQSILVLAANDDGLVTVTMSKSRGAPIHKSKAPQFRWSPIDGLFMSVPPSTEPAKKPGAPSKYDLLAILGDSTLSKEDFWAKAEKTGMSISSFNRLLRDNIDDKFLTQSDDGKITARPMESESLL